MTVTIIMEYTVKGKPVWTERFDISIPDAAFRTARHLTVNGSQLRDRESVTFSREMEGKET
jgi:hypothetical protein